jgi:periplasmic protein CpxP/Spy
MKKTFLGVLALVAILAGAAGLTAFRHSHRDPTSFISARVDKMLDAVNASDQQRQQIGAIRDKVLADMKTLHQSNKGVHDQFLAFWQQDNPDASQVHQLIADRAAAHKAFADEVADALVQVHGILTPQQRATLAQKMQQHHQQHEQQQHNQGQ